MSGGARCLMGHGTLGNFTHGDSVQGMYCPYLTEHCVIDFEDWKELLSVKSHSVLSLYKELQLLNRRYSSI